MKTKTYVKALPHCAPSRRSPARGVQQSRGDVAVYLDESQPLEKRVEDALSRMTLEEKVGLLHAQSKFSIGGRPAAGHPRSRAALYRRQTLVAAASREGAQGLEKVHLAPGQSRTVTFEIDPGCSPVTTMQKGVWGAEPGEFTAYVGAASDDIRGTVDFVLK